jgi:hypothetical protein
MRSPSRRPSCVLLLLTAFTVAAPGCGGTERSDSLDQNATGAVERPLVDNDSEYVPTQVGMLHRSCLHEVPTGATIDEDNNVTKNGAFLKHLAPCNYKPKSTTATGAALLSAGGSDPGPCPPGTKVCWNAWVEGRAPTNAWGQNWFTGFDVDWRVPHNPTNASSQLLYYFPGLQGNTRIIQPVLQYGAGPAGGGAYWSMGNFYVWTTAGGAMNMVNSPLVRVSQSDIIHGEMASFFNSCTSDGKCGWEISFTVNGGNFQSLDILTTPERFWRADKAVLESYGVTSCDQYPNENAAQFYNVAAFMPGPSVNAWNFAPLTWVPGVMAAPNPNCRFAAGNSPGAKGFDSSGIVYWIPTM